MGKKEIYALRFEAIIKKAEYLRDFVKQATKKGEQDLQNHIQMIKEYKETEKIK